MLGLLKVDRDPIVVVIHPGVHPFVPGVVVALRWVL